MHVRAVTAQLRRGKTRESIDLVRYSVLAVTKAQKGFRGFYQMNDASSGKSVAISTWDTEADMMAGEISSYYLEQIAKMGIAFAGSPTVEHYEVSVEASV